MAITPAENLEELRKIQEGVRGGAAAAATAMFRLAQEALGNSAEHAQAKQVLLQLRYSDAGLELRLRDDGCGFDVAGTLRQPREGLGLTNMRERMETLGGHFGIQSAPGATVVSASLPPAALKS